MEVAMRYKHISVSELGGPGALRLRTSELPVPGPGEVRVRVVAAGVSFGDVLLRAGVIPGGPKRPFVPGFDVTGVVDRIGAEVTGLEPGQMVTALVRSGGYAEYAIVPAARVVPVPDGTDPVQVAAVVLNYFIAYQMLHRVARVQPGERILVHGAAGGVGVAFLQLGATAAIEIYGTCSAGKRDIVAGLGAHPIDYQSEDFLDVVRALPGGSVDVVFDPVGGSHFRRSYRALRRGGSLIAYGQSEAYRGGQARKLVGAWGFLGGIVLPKLIPDGKTTLFYNAWSLEKKDPQAYREDIGVILELLAKGKIGPSAIERLPLESAVTAHEVLERGTPTGKIVLTS
jgi:NADPH:quinone reductase-like Zn-dependent oxidoreductase